MWGLVITATGWTVQQLEATPWPDVLELMHYWVAFPPIHILVKKGFFKEADQPRTITNPDELQAAIKDF